jgi:NAD(P)H-dependent flavin oxidoreductase YrpB (nitropropane dioxygenase family)
MTSPPSMLNTRITDLFGITHPILAGGLMWLSDARYVAGVVNAGGMAFMTPRSFENDTVFAQQLALCADLTHGKPFGVNLSMSKRLSANEVVPRHLQMALDAGVRHFETVGPSPGVLFEQIHAAGGVVIHKAAFVAHALKAEALGADAIALVGMEAGGHPGMNELSSSMLCAYALDALTVPLAMGGGIGHGRQIAAALAMGCEAVLIGTRLLACDEVWTHEAVKDLLVTSGHEASTVVLRSVGDPWRVLANDTAREVQRLEAAGTREYADFGPLILGRTGRDGAYRAGEVQRGLLSLGPSVGFANKRQPIAAVVDQLMAEAVANMQRFEQRFARALTRTQGSVPSEARDT